VVLLFFGVSGLKLGCSDADSELRVGFHNKYALAIGKNGYDGM
jgi:hypothetical protein